jgi:N-acetylneuraminate synthase
MENISQKIFKENHIFVIAEIGNNHNGNIDLAFEMIDKAKVIGVDCVKFQMRHIDQVYRKKSLVKSGEDLGTEYIIDLLNKFELSVDEHLRLAEYCNEIGIYYMCTPWDLKSIEVLELFKVQAYKVASADLTNIPLIQALIETKKPIILSTGMSTLDEIKFTASYLDKNKANYALLHCNSTYPAPIQDINLNFIHTLKNIHDKIGYSGHERGINITLAAVALGASIVERHFTLDRLMEGPDHAASLEFEEFRSLVLGIREIEKALGEGNSRTLSQGEMINRENLGKSLVAARSLQKGDVLTSSDIKILSPGQGLSPQNFEKLVGKKLHRDINFEDYFFKTDLVPQENFKSSFDFEFKWGIPVRYHDFQKFNEIVEPDLYEFHLSYSDMELDPSDFLKGPYEFGFVVHAPELFKESHLMDLATDDEEYRKNSILETQKVIDITRSLKRFFPNEKKPMIVANIGGFSMDEPFEEEKKKRYYDQFFESLNLLDLEGVELIPQTMAPFPWHFGGQRYQNIFVMPEEIAYYCSKNKIRMCLDVSHSMLTCNHFGLDFYEFVREVAPYTAHLHLGDAKGVNGEGLQIGEGEINFNLLANILLEKCPNATFIPEIWQGHKNNGEGFWEALTKLEGIL